MGKVELKLRPYSERFEPMPSERDTFGDAVGAFAAHAGAVRAL